VIWRFPRLLLLIPLGTANLSQTPWERLGGLFVCHLAAKPAEVEVPQSVLPDTVFEAIVKIPYDTNVQQVIADGSKGLKRRRCTDAAGRFQNCS